MAKSSLFSTRNDLPVEVREKVATGRQLRPLRSDKAGPLECKGAAVLSAS
jgi:hypothetical protein